VECTVEHCGQPHPSGVLLSWSCYSTRYGVWCCIGRTVHPLDVLNNSTLGLQIAHSGMYLATHTRMATLPKPAAGRWRAAVHPTAAGLTQGCPAVLVGGTTISGMCCIIKHGGIVPSRVPAAASMALHSHL
jgi:hypothetical protein